MDVDAHGPVSQSYTILRIKRKRTDEPLDALVVESKTRRKRSRGGIGLFQFAQTVEEHEWEDAKRRQDIQDEISRLAQEKASKADPLAPDPAPAPPISRQSRDDSGPRYTIIKQDDDERQLKRLPTSPPKVISAKDVPSKTAGFKMYDAVLSTDNAPSLASDPEMEKFLPLLTDYLKLHDMLPTPQPTSQSAVTSETNPTTARSATATSSDDYVWDVFYHRPATLSEWNSAANVGTLTGLPPSITDPGDSDSASEEEDEADEDSNAEEYYKNDYPDEEDPSDESGSSDEFHEHSDYEDAMRGDGDGDWR